jgi:hypothetical protein
MKKTAFLFSMAGATALLVGSTVAKAAVMPLDTFSFDLTAFDANLTTGYYITSEETATFGATTTFTGIGYDGQDISIASSESFGATTTTDTFTVSTPTNFLTDASIGGTTIGALQFDMGDPNSGGNPVNLVLPFGSYTAVGGAIDGVNNMVVLPVVNTFPGSGNTSYAAAVGISTGSETTPIDTYTVHSLTYSITYTDVVPEPSSLALAGIGAVAGALAIRRRRKIA